MKPQLRAVPPSADWHALSNEDAVQRLEQEAPQGPTPLQRQFDRLGKRLARGRG